MIKFDGRQGLLFLGICLMVFSVTRGQGLYPVSTDEKISRSSLIVEGKVISKKSFWNPQHTMIYTSNKVEVYKLFKGNLPNTTAIDVITTGGAVDGQLVIASHLLELQTGDIGVFFCYDNSGKELPAGSVTRKPFNVYSSAQGFLKYDQFTKTAIAPFSKFDNISGTLYQELSRKTGRKTLIINRAFNVEETTPSSSGTIISNSVLAPTITSFSPTTVYAGKIADVANNLLTISGSGFGARTGQAEVQFANADASAGSFASIGLGNVAIVSWNDTEIKVRVPSNAGTGNIRVTDANGNMTTSAGILNIPYSILSGDLGGLYGLKQLNLVNDNGSGGYTVKYSSNTANSGVNLDASPAKATFQRALNTWKETVGLNFAEGGTTSIQKIDANDNENIIVFDNAASGFQSPMEVGVLATCYSYAAACGNNPATDQVYKSGFDIIIRNPGYSQGSTSFTFGPCPPIGATPPQVDLETVLLHELGHALNLGHIIDPFQNNGTGTNNPGKVMHFSVATNFRRISLDNPAKLGGTYTVQPRGLTYGSCLPANPEMVPVNTISEPKDDCPLAFPTSVTPLLSTVNFNLTNATSNKAVDPDWIELKADATGTSITNTVFYAFRTNASGGDISLEIKNYTTTPEGIAACVPPSAIPVTGIQMSIYQVSTCPVPGSYPPPIHYTVISGNGTLPTISGLAGNTSYLMVLDGVENTKAVFDMVFSGPALSPKLTSLNGTVEEKGNQLNWTAEISPDVDAFFIERSEDGIHFSEIREITSTAEQQSGNYLDARPLPGTNHYRLAIHNINGSVDYSSIVVLTRTETFFLNVYPNPLFTATDNQKLTVEILDINAPGRYGLSIYNALGQPVLNKILNITSRNHVETLTLNHLAKGMYYVTIYGQDDKRKKSVSVMIQ